MSRPGAFGSALLCGVVVSLALAAGAVATTFCVPGYHSRCPNNGTNEAQANLETAATTMPKRNDGIDDTIIVAAGHVYTDTGTFEPLGPDDLVIDGGSPSTVMTSSSSGNVFVVNLNTSAAEVTLKNLTVRIPSSFPNGLGAGMQLDGSVLDDVQIVSNNPDTDGIPSVVGGAELHGVSFPDTGTGSVHSAIRFGSGMTGTLEVDGAVMTDVINGISGSDSPGQLEVSGSRIGLSPTSGQAAIGTTRGTTLIRNSVIETPKGVPFSMFVPSGKSAVLVADGVTMYDTNPLPSTPVLINTAGTGTATAGITNSIASGYTGAFDRQATGSGTANVAISYSNSPPAGAISSGPGSATVTNGVNAVPQFTDAAAGDFSLQPGSPSIDAGNPSSLLDVDFLGQARPLDGDGDGDAVVDQGAFEYVPPPDTTAPKTEIVSGPGAKAAKGKPRFRFSANEAATFECSLVKRGKAPKYRACTSPAKYKLKRKRVKVKYKFAVRATDAAGNVDATPAAVSFKVKRK